MSHCLQVELCMSLTKQKHQPWTKLSEKKKQTNKHIPEHSMYSIFTYMFHERKKTTKCKYCKYTIRGVSGTCDLKDHSPNTFPVWTSCHLPLRAPLGGVGRLGNTYRLWWINVKGNHSHVKLQEFHDSWPRMLKKTWEIALVSIKDEPNKNMQTGPFWIFS